MPPTLERGRAWPDPPSLEALAPPAIPARWGLFVGGRWRAPRGRAYAPAIDPSTGAAITSVAVAGAGDVDAAVRAARAASAGAWSRARPGERAKLLFRLAGAVRERARDLAIAESMGAGIPVKDTTGFDAPLAAAHLFHYAGWADKLEYAFAGRPHRPAGVAALIVESASPLAAAACKLAPALACGAAVVLLASEAAPLSALMLARIVEESGLPAGVVNVVTGPAAARDALASHAGVDAVVFSGGAEGGERVQRAAAGGAARKKVTLDLGGEAASIVFADAAIDQAADAIVGAAHVRPGPLRAGAWRCLVEESVAEAVVRRLRDRFAALRVGPPLDRSTDVGPVASEAARDALERLAGAAEREGAERFSPAGAVPPAGYWFSPTLLVGVSRSSRAAAAEVPGPVLVVSTFRTAGEAVEKANNTARPMAAGVWTDKGSKALWVARRLAAGAVWCNAHARFDPAAPFGAARGGGAGRDGGREALRAYVEVG